MQPAANYGVDKLYAGQPFSYSEVLIPLSSLLACANVSFHSFNSPLTTSQLNRTGSDTPSTQPPLGPFHLQHLDAATADALNPANIRTWPTITTSPLSGAQAAKFFLTRRADNQITSFESERFYWHLRALESMQTHILKRLRV